jgi:hypothetical protein
MLGGFFSSLLVLLWHFVRFRRELEVFIHH